MKKILKILGAVVVVLLLIGVLIGWIAHEPLPEGRSGAEADALAHKMLKALNYKNYQTTRYLEWSFQGGKNHYLWDKARGTCRVQWENYTVALNLVDPKQSTVTSSGASVPSGTSEKIIDTALAYFNNDSFWLVAPYKVFDTGTSRSIVALENGKQGLLVTYTSGGTTPGDSYLWILNDAGFPEAYKMWVQILPIGGLEASWKDWTTTKSGAFLPSLHQLGPISLSMGDVKGYN
ncbi:MAG: hypothetical protein AAF717_01720 [Bacteroidota bacterium]